MCEFVLVVRGAVGILSEINVKAFSIFSIVIVSRPVQLNHVSIMKREMEFWQVEGVPNAEIDENCLILMEESKCITEKGQSLRTMIGILGKVYKVQ